MTRKKSPQQKKRESYEKERRSARQATAAAQVPERAERLEGKAVVNHGGMWRKIADKPLGEVLEGKLKRWTKMGSLSEGVADTKASRMRGLT